MIYRELGKTGKKVSVIGHGCEHLDGKPYSQAKETIEAALENGVNIFDVFMPGKEIRENIARALGEKRKDVFIQGHIGSTDINQQYDISRDMPTVKRFFEDELRIFGGYIDFGMLFFIDSDEDYKNVFDTEFITYVERLKKQGDIRHIGFSSHNPETAAKVIETGVAELMLFSINPAFDMLPPNAYVFDHFEKGFGTELFRGIDPKRAQIYKLCTQKQIGITVMKAFGAGKLLSAEHTPFEKPMTIAQCLHYALSRPAVSSVMGGFKTAAEVAEAMNYFSATEEEKDYSEIISKMRNDFKGNCVYCSHCQPCPAQIDIAAVNKYLDIARLDKGSVPPSVKSHYKSLAHRGDECTSCGSCESRCPFGVAVADNMIEAEKLLAF
ncbi:MAG: aldo/keto reductase [Clostridiales bacterium]|jgi:predicted aldo/keto reductase-like oxidoreductase|nr:aldo/keto reductase [Clostridiales bacterium]